MQGRVERFRFIAAGMVVLAAVLAAPVSASAWSYDISQRGSALYLDVARGSSVGEATVTVQGTSSIVLPSPNSGTWDEDSYWSGVPSANYLFDARSLGGSILLSGVWNSIRVSSVEETSTKVVVLLARPATVVTGTVSVSNWPSATAEVGTVSVLATLPESLTITGTVPVDVVSADEVLGLKPAQVTAVSIILVLTCGAVLYRAVS